jgi:hypothetical protein
MAARPGQGTCAISAARASTPSSPKITTSWSESFASARTTTSGPMPVGSPSEMPSRGMRAK